MVVNQKKDVAVPVEDVDRAIEKLKSFSNWVWQRRFSMQENEWRIMINDLNDILGKLTDALLYGRIYNRTQS